MTHTLVRRGTHFGPAALLCALLTCNTLVHAFKVDTGDSEAKLRWDNTVKYSVMYRMNDQSDGLASTMFGPSGLVGPNNTNQDDGDNNFDKGLVSNRLDLLTELDAAYGNFGGRISAAAWYDEIYNSSTDNDTFTSNHTPASEFSDNTKKVMGKDSEILDAFIYTRFKAGDGTATVRLGRHTILWGESLFFGSNGIAGGQAPLDLVKLLSVPSSQFKEVARPTGKLSADIPLNETFTLGVYVGYEWDKTRFAPAGSYLSTSDVIEGERINAGPIGSFIATDDMKPSDKGQYGLKLLWTASDIDTDFGLYAIRYHANTPSNIYTTLNGVPPAGLSADSYRWVYHEDITALGASFTKAIGNWSLAGELSIRQNMPLASIGAEIIPTIGVNADLDNKDNPGYSVGKTGHAQFSWLASLEPSFISDEASFLGEIAWNARLKVDENIEMQNPLADRSATAIRMIYRPTYRQLFSGMDVSPSISIGHTWGKSSAVGPGFGVDGGGDLNIGVSSVYLNQWNFTLNYITYLGPEGGNLDNNQHVQFKQALKDRDFVSLSLSTTF